MGESCPLVLMSTIKDKDDLAGEIICTCSGTTRGQIVDLVQQGMDLEAISRWTGAKTGCGGCDWDLELFVRALSEQQNT